MHGYRRYELAPKVNGFMLHIHHKAYLSSDELSSAAINHSFLTKHFHYRKTCVRIPVTFMGVVVKVIYCYDAADKTQAWLLLVNKEIIKNFNETAIIKWC
jgi:hypothetical protein